MIIAAVLVRPATASVNSRQRSTGRPNRSEARRTNPNAALWTTDARVMNAAHASPGSGLLATSTNATQACSAVLARPSATAFAPIRPSATQPSAIVGVQ